MICFNHHENLTITKQKVTLVKKNVEDKSRNQELLHSNIRNSMNIFSLQFFKALHSSYG